MSTAPSSAAGSAITSGRPAGEAARRSQPRDDWRARVEAQGLVFHTHARHRRLLGRGHVLRVHAGRGRRDRGRDARAPRALPRRRRARDRAIAATPSSGSPARDRARRAQLARRAAVAVRPHGFRVRPDGVPKLLEYNADTPTSLLEGGVIQWTWLADCFPDARSVQRDPRPADRDLARARALASARSFTSRTSTISRTR